jgi:hypothetical protein
MEKISGVVLAGALMAICLHVFNNINFLILAIISSGVYFVALWLFKTLKASEIASLISKQGVQEYDELS